VLAGQAGVAGHLKIGDGAQIGAQAGVMQDVAAGVKVLGSPAQDPRDVMRQIAAVRRLPELLKKFAAWERNSPGK
jgi:UDP-3-O-[3-hydroxymyristoyl] glucosamine N-acyltransferase